METQEFFKKWKKDSPKSFEEFKIFLGKQWYPFDDTYIDEYCNFWIEMGDDRKSELPFEMLTGIIHNFFLENKIDTFTKLKDILLKESCFFEDGKIFYQNILQNIFLQSAEIMEMELK